MEGSGLTEVLCLRQQLAAPVPGAGRPGLTQWRQALVGVVRPPPDPGVWKEERREEERENEGEEEKERDDLPPLI